MPFQASVIFSEIFFLCLTGVQSWYYLSYSQPRVCVRKGASVVLPCTYDYSWIGHYMGGEWYEETRGRIREYNNPKYPDCSLNIEKASDCYPGLYKFRFYTALHRSWITGQSGVTLSVVDLQVKEEAAVGNQNQTNLTCSNSCILGSQYVWYKNGQRLQDKTASIQLDSTRSSEAAVYDCAIKECKDIRSPTVCAPAKHCWKCSSNSTEEQILQVTVTPETVTEGGNVTLTCNSTCTPGYSLIFIWYNNGQPVSDKHTTGDNKLHLNPVSREDAGLYSCAVGGHKDVSSNAVLLNVTYVPKNVSVSISVSVEIEKGSTVTLTCCSDANPPTHNYTWYMRSGAESLVRGTGESISFTSDTSGLYYCVAHNEVGHQNSNEVRIGTKDDPAADMMIQSGIIFFVILTITLVLASLWLRMKNKTNLSSNPHTSETSDVYANIVAMTITSDLEVKRRDPRDGDDVHYASIQSRPQTEKQEYRYGNVKKARRTRQEKDVVYASVQLNQARVATWSDDDSPIYSIIKKEDFNKVSGV